MSHDKLENFINKAKEIALSEKEKAAVKQSLLKFMIENPTRSSLSRSGFLSGMFSMRFSFVPTMAVVIVVALLLGGGAGMAAEKSLPGDVLYPVKVGINEELKSILLVSDEAKSNWEIERSQRRLQEAAKLASAGTLNADNRAIIEGNFRAHMEKVQNRIAKFETKEDFNSAADVSSNFETSLNAHEKILSSLLDKETNTGKKGEIRPLMTQVKSAAKSAKTNRQKNELEVSSNNKSGVEASARGKLVAAENKIKETEKYIDSVKAGFDTETALQAEAKLEAARTTFEYAKSKLDAKDYGAAFNSFQQAIRIAQEAKLLIAAGNDLHLDVWSKSNIGGDDDGDDDDDGDRPDNNGPVKGKSQVDDALD